MKGTLLGKIETKLMRLHGRVVELRKVYAQRAPDPFRQLGLVPLDRCGGKFAPEEGQVVLVQEELCDMEKAFLAASLILRLKGTEENMWLRGLRKLFHQTRAMVEALKQDILLHHWTLLMAVRADLVKHALLRRLDPWLTETMLLIRDALPEQNAAEFAALATKRALAYAQLPVMQRVVPDAASLSAHQLRLRLARLFEVTVQRWDRCHGLAVPQVWARLAAFAYGQRDLFLDLGVSAGPRALIAYKGKKGPKRSEKAEKWRKLACVCCPQA